MKHIIFLTILFIVTKGFGQIEKQTKMDTIKTERFKKGWEKLKEIDGEAGEKVIESLKDISPELGTFIIEYAFGDKRRT
jgi:4-carboxymuconolactone decarboxylase